VGEAARTVFIKTYGCQMNVYDSNRMAELLAPLGYSGVESPEAADLVILNTCHIREKAAEKVFSDIGRLRGLEPQRRANGRQTLLAVAGCVAQAEGQEILRRAKTVNLVFGPQTYHRLPEFLAEAATQQAKGLSPRVIDIDFPAVDKFDAMPTARSATGPAAFLTVQEGCDKFCSFCVVPFTRGAETSRPAADIVAEAQALIDQGVKEITLLGQNVNAYHGRGTGGAVWSLADLLARLSDVSGLERLRYTTSHPLDMGADLIAAHGSLPKLMPYLHLPVQAGSDRVLAAMNRRHTAADYLAIIDRLKAAQPDLALSGDFIVGFPGETEADFEATLDLVRRVGYAQAYSFKYSIRPGTKAGDAPDQVPEPEKVERLARLQALLNELQLAFNQAKVGSRMTVLFDRPGKRPGQWVGRSPWMQSVHVDAPEAQLGDLMTVEIASAGPNSLEGRLLSRPLAA
jgi:tRNA-2-methylthio-N6-dimethylallyladenosine synthase